jgi:hypothetical protein
MERLVQFENHEFAKRLTLKSGQGLADLLDVGTDTLRSRQRWKEWQWARDNPHGRYPGEDPADASRSPEKGTRDGNGEK